MRRLCKISQITQSKCRTIQLIKFNPLRKKQISIRTDLRDEKIVIGDTFLYVKGSTRFEEVEDGKVRCGGCLKIFSRIIGHITKSIDCRINIDVDEFRLSWTKHTKKRQNAKCYKKKKEESKEEVLREYERKQSNYTGRMREENAKKFLQEMGSRRRKCDSKQKAENVENFLKEKASRQRKCDSKQKAEM